MIISMSKIFFHQWILIGLLATLQISSCIGQAKEKSAIISFTMKNIHPHDLATILGEQNICVRAGHHCTQPLIEYFKCAGTVRVSIAFYNTKEEIDELVKGVIKAKQMLK